jgi:hypothetical protein
MKTILFTLLFTTTCIAQFNFETEYSGGYLSRIVLENSGEKYYIYNSSGNIEFYNANHTNWKIINLAIPPNNYSLSIHDISENKFNSDNLIEIAYTFKNASNVYQSKIVNELGVEMLSIDNSTSLKIDEQVGQSTKIISSSTTESKVYNVPDLVLEHTFSNIDVKRINLETSGLKYYTFDITTGIVNIYNIDYTIWKSVVLNKPTGYSFSGIQFISENQVNSDNLIEIGFGYYINGSSPNKKADIINENGTILLSVINAQNILVSKIDGLPNKLIANLYTSSTDSHETQVYSCPDLLLEHTYIGNIDRVKLEISGEKYYDRKPYMGYSATPVPDETIIYNSDHTIWKTIATPNAFPGGGSIMDVYVSETKFDTDNQVELSYTCSSNALNGGAYESFIINEDGSQLFYLPETSGIYLSELPNLQSKLIVYIFHKINFNYIQYFTRVYNLGQNAGVKDFDLQQVTISPNPATDYLELNSKNNVIKKAVICDLQGKIIQDFEGENLKIIDIRNISLGLYIVKFTDNSNNSFSTKFIKTSN